MVRGMTNTTPEASSQQLVAAIKTLEGWYYLLENAEDYGGRGPGTRTFGALLSSVLLAGGEGVLPLFLTGEVSDTGTGRLVLVYPDSIVTVSAARMEGNDARYETQVHPFADVSELTVQTKHSHFDGTETSPRHRGFAFGFKLAGSSVHLSASTWSVVRNDLTGDDAAYAAFVAIRSAVLSR